MFVKLAKPQSGQRILDAFASAGKACKWHRWELVERVADFSCSPETNKLTPYSGRAILIARANNDSLIELLVGPLVYDEEYLIFEMEIRSNDKSVKEDLRSWTLDSKSVIDWHEVVSTFYRLIR